MSRLRLWNVVCLGSVCLLLLASACGRAPVRTKQAQPPERIVTEISPGIPYGTRENEATPNPNRLSEAWWKSEEIRASRDIADAIAQLPEVKHASVLLAGDTAFVAVVLETGDGTEVPEELKQQVASKARSADFRLTNVYVSASPEFVDRLNAYVSEQQDGRPVPGMARELRDMTKQLVPIRLSPQPQQ